MREKSLLDECLDFNNKWSFDKNYLRKIIALGNKKLEDRTLSRRMRQSIKIDIETFSRFINDDFELRSDCYNFSTPKNIDKLRDYILFKMKRQYDVLGDDLIKFIIDLNEERIFEESYSITDITSISMEEQIELIIKNYERNMPKFVNPARVIMLDSTVKQIQVIDDDDSYCHYDSITRKAYVLVNMLDAPCIFNHEIEHAIEEYLRYPTNILYDELGAILSEMLFNEEIYKYNGCLEPGDYDFRLDNTSYLLNCVYSYFKILLMFSSKNFNISTNELIDAFINNGITNEKMVLEYLREDIATNYMEGNMGYLFSFLKALELRELFINKSNDSFDIFEYYLKKKKFVFRKPCDGFKLYSRYIDDVKSRVRKK